MSLNKCCLIGNVGKDPEIRTTQDGRKIASFSLATSEKWKDKNTGERKERSEWHKIVIFNPNLVTVVTSYVKKGSKLYVEGAIQTRKWQDKEGKDNYTTEIILQAFTGTIVMLDSKKDSGSGNNGAEDVSTDSGLDDEIPF